MGGERIVYVIEPSTMQEFDQLVAISSIGIVCGTCEINGSNGTAFVDRGEVVHLQLLKCGGLIHCSYELQDNLADNLWSMDRIVIGAPLSLKC